MAARVEHRGPKLGDAASLWNFTPSPGWSVEETRVLRLLLMRHGVGRWVAILGTGLLPGKLVQQVYGATQRLLGQQSLAAFTGLRLDLDAIRGDNEARRDAPRKSGLVIHDGPVQTREERELAQAEAQKRYGLTEPQLEEVEAEVQALMDKMNQDAPAWSQHPLLVRETAALSPDELRGLLATLRGTLMRLRGQLGAAIVRRRRATRATPAAGEDEATPGQAGTEEKKARRPPRPRRTQGDALGSRPASRAGRRRPAGRGRDSSEDDDTSDDMDWRPSGGHGGASARPRREEAAQGRRRRCTVSAGPDGEDWGAVIDPGDVALLVAMGFQEAQALEALRATDGHMEAALELLLSMA